MIQEYVRSGSASGTCDNGDANTEDMSMKIKIKVIPIMLLFNGIPPSVFDKQHGKGLHSRIIMAWHHTSLHQPIPEIQLIVMFIQRGSKSCN